MQRDSNFAGWAILIAIAGILAYSGVFYQTGAQWYETCWYAQHSTKPPETPAIASSWAQCPAVAGQAFYGSGMIFSPHLMGAIHTQAVLAVDNACPRGGDLVATGVDAITAGGGSGLVYKFLPASMMLSRTYQEQWPNCIRAREINGFPKMVETKGGWFDWVSECQPCEAEAKAAKDAFDYSGAVISTPR